jgi:hypothetical protein
MVCVEIDRATYRKVSLRNYVVFPDIARLELTSK